MEYCDKYLILNITYIEQEDGSKDGVNDEVRGRDQVEIHLAILVLSACVRAYGRMYADGR